VGTPHNGGSRCNEKQDTARKKTVPVTLKKEDGAAETEKAGYQGRGGKEWGRGRGEKERRRWGGGGEGAEGEGWKVGGGGVQRRGGKGSEGGNQAAVG